MNELQSHYGFTTISCDSQFLHGGLGTTFRLHDDTFMILHQGSERLKDLLYQILYAIFSLPQRLKQKAHRPRAIYIQYSFYSKLDQVQRTWKWLQQCCVLIHINSKSQLIHGLPSILWRKISTLLHTKKDDMDLGTPDIYSTLSECGNTYLGQTCFMETRVNVQTIAFTLVSSFTTPESWPRI
jgi:hypothetical protein